MKITSKFYPNECCIYYFKSSVKHPETSFKSKIKQNWRWWKEGKKVKERPYWKFAEDIQVEAEIIGVQSSLLSLEDLEKYCETLTIILNQSQKDQKNLPSFQQEDKNHLPCELNQSQLCRAY